MYTDLATQLISWLRSKTRILAHLPLAVLRAVITRWTAHYVAYRRLLQLYPSIKGLVFSDLTRPDAEKVLISGDSASKRKAREMLTIIENPLFWHSIALYVEYLFYNIYSVITKPFYRIARYLEPLAIAANVVQDSFCRLDQVLLTFGFLLMTYRNDKMKDDPVGRDAIIASMEARWAKCDQQIFVCAVLVNPFYRTLPFAQIPCFFQPQIRVLLTTLYVRFYGKQPDNLFIDHAFQFFNRTGFFDHLENQLKYKMDMAAKEVNFIAS